VLRGQTGPSGAPALTDLLGVMESWSATETTVRGEDGSLTTIALADVVAGKPVPPRPSTRMRVTPAQACRLSNASWPAVVTEPLGDWLLRASGGFSARANSVMAVGDPGMPFGEALDVVHAFYADQGLPAWAQLVVGSAEHASFEDAGWKHARTGEADTLFQMASVARAARAARRSLPGGAPEVSMSTTASAAWLANDTRIVLHGQTALDVLQAPDQVGFGSALPSEGRDDPPVIAKGRVAVARDWAGITDLWVSPDHRRQGLAVAVMGALLDWAAERGATTAYLQTRGDNPPALALYERLGFVTHHAYRYLASERPV
jgi:N-acetylglutamate synthase